MAARKHNPAEDWHAPQLEEKLYAPLEKYCRFLASDKWECEELFQAAILKGLESYHIREITPALLKKIAYHQWIDLGRKGKYEVVGIPDDAGQAVSHSIEGKIDAIQLLLDRLTPKQAVTFTLKEAFNFQAKEIAHLLNLPETSVKSLLHRARARLNQEQRIHGVDSQWNEADRSLLAESLNESLLRDDPAVFIKSLPALRSLREVPGHSVSRKGTPPLCMAA